MTEGSSSLDSWRLQLEDSDRQFYQNLVESDRKFYKNLNDLKISFGMPPVMRSCEPVVNQEPEDFKQLSCRTTTVADGTRMRSFEDSIHKVEVQLQRIQEIKTVNETPAIEAPIQGIKALSQEIDSNLQFIENPKELQIRLESLETHEENEVLEPGIAEYIDESKVIPKPLNARMFDAAIKEMGECGDVLIDSSRFEKPDLRWIAMEFLATPNMQQLFVELSIKLADFRVNSIGFSEFLCAHKVFVERSTWQNLGETGMNMASQGVEVSTVIAMGISKQRMLDGIGFSIQELLFLVWEWACLSFC